jgi:small subunit ribosomal protein S6
MTLPAPTYDLVVLLDTQAEEDVRAKLVADARAAIEAQGELLRHDDWGTRTLAYPIDRKTVAEYHLLQFHAGKPELLGSLERSLRIADDILRFRIVKLKPGVPDAPDMKSAGSSAPAAEPAPQAAREGATAAGVEASGEGEAPGEGATAAGVEASVEVDAAVEVEVEPELEPPADPEPQAADPATPPASAEPETAVSETQ